MLNQLSKFSHQTTFLKNYLSTIKILRQFSHLPTGNNKKNEREHKKQRIIHNSNFSSDNWSQIYKLPLIQWVAAFNKLKLYQIGLVTIGIPSSFILESSAYIPENGAIIFTSLGFTGLITLSLASWIVKDLIGIIYINDKMDKLKFAYVDFWGKRQNVEFEIDKIIPPYEFSSTKLKFYQIVTDEEKNGLKLKLIQKFAHIYDVERFSSIFGE